MASAAAGGVASVEPLGSRAENRRHRRWPVARGDRDATRHRLERREAEALDAATAKAKHAAAGVEARHLRRARPGPSHTSRAGVP